MARPKKKVEEKKEVKKALTNEELKELMKGKTRCTQCGKVLSDTVGFYVSKSNMYKFTGRVALCKDCVTEYLTSNVLIDGDMKKTIYKMCSKLDLCFKNDYYNQALKESKVVDIPTVKNVLAVWKKYIKNMNSLGMKNNGIVSYEQSDFIDIHDLAEDVDKKVKEKVSKITSEEEIEKMAIYKQNKLDIIKMLGYDPFDKELEDDKPKMYATLIDMMTEDVQSDVIKKGACLDVIRTRNQIEKIDDAIVTLNKDTKNIIDNMNSVSGLIKTKGDLNKVLTTTVKENKMVEGKTAGANSFTGKEKKMNELDLEAIQVNLYDQETSLGMQQVADISLRASIKELNFGDDTLSEIVKMQRQELDNFRKEYKGLREENRRLKALCNLNSIDYKNFLIKENWEEELKFDKEKFQEDMNDRLELEKEIKPISINSYAEEKLKEKEKINKEKIKKELEKDL